MIVCCGYMRQSILHRRAGLVGYQYIVCCPLRDIKKCFFS